MSKIITQITVAFFLCIVTGCQKRSIPLPNHYQLISKNRIETVIVDPSKRIIISDPVNQFVVHKEHVYGWIDSKKGDFFYLNTKTGDLQIFATWKELSVYTDSLKIPRLDMKYSYTYYDIIDGRKSPSW